MSQNDQRVESWREYFRSAHSADPQNAARQSFDEYWHWVNVFFVSGGAGYPGWFGQVAAALAGVHDRARRERLADRLQTLGKTVAAEWAKERRYRRIHSTFFQGTPNLQEWGRQLQRAAADDTGDGAAIERALADIERAASAARQ
jgi:hypothetical protein